MMDSQLLQVSVARWSSTSATTKIAVYAIATALCYATWLVVYAYFFSPVRHVPGPFWSRVTSVPYRMATFKARRSAYAHRLIESYGAIVVIAPDHVHTSDEMAMKTIYDRTSIKTSFYSNMGSWKGVTTTLGKLDYASAAPTRTNLIQCFQNRNLEMLSESIDGHVLQFVDILRSFARTGSNVDGVVYFRLLALDIVTDVLWGDQTNLLAHAAEDTPVFLRRFFAFSSYNALKSFMPIVETWVKHIGWPKKWATLRKDCLDMDVTAREALEKWNARSTKIHKRDVLSMLSEMSTDDDPQNRIEQDHLPAYMVEMMAAGSSTTSHTAAFACWALTNNAEAQKKLRKELFDLFPDPSQIEMKASQAGSMLDAVIKETMRMWPMIPGPLERYLGRPIEVDGKVIPPGVKASTSALTSGRKADVYDSPNVWRPERWLIADEQELERMRVNWTPFGYGSRICPGSNLALTELKYMLCAIFRNFRAVQPKDLDWENIEMADVFAAGTVSGHCWLRFEEDVNDP